MKRGLLVLCVLAMCALPHGRAVHGSLATAVQSDVEVAWEFDIQTDSMDNPQGKVFLVVNGRKILLRPQAAAQYSVLERAEYKSRDVPSGALTASTGWWAGQGEDMYVIRRKNQLVVYIRYLDEGTSIPPYRRLKVIRL